MRDEMELESLAAKKNISDLDAETYMTSLEKALSDSSNKNIAITGGYGSGKTTIIDSYFESRPEKANKMMRVSIATFEKDQTDFDTSTNDQNLLEQQILQQMFYQVRPNKIPNSKFVKVSDLSFWFIFRIIFCCTVIILLTFFTINQKWIVQLHAYLTINGSVLLANILSAVAIIAIISMNVFLLYILIIIFRKLGISKFGFSNARIEFNLDDGNRVFNYYLDEIIYLFKKNNYCYIIFEDLDRFQSIKVFERLRGLNTLLNNSSQLQGRDIKFVYALKDDIFTESDESDSVYNRTKFFDFIIPAIKILHGSNAESILFNKLKKFWPENQESANVEYKNKQLSKQLVEDVALYINDMRTLINICNEFEVFRLRLNKSRITYDHLFAFVVYKNMYPKDYSDLIENRGIVYNIFNKKDEIVNKLQNDLENLRDLKVNGLGSIITQKEDLSILFVKKRDLLGKKIKMRNHQDLNLDGQNYLRAANTLFNYVTKKEISAEILVCLSNGNFIKNFANINEFMNLNNVNYFELYTEFENREIQMEENINKEFLILKIKLIMSKLNL